ncbi:hypothetical protein Mpet_1441 [Methanolacinia petrolearia DSM 11571]|uniref:Uncharacterized protein n=1 Tax=Methanolacinia petrolearia (strain DSM 11571 / OCM 486 / SEBR 4847) TaxID=679926 RepID=E1RFH0_METP4|nr:hypothetical protein [Methanolacinia petrolearia]ADN36200.1 hypothetical protein Mpet_1441 [Methanolacinia petrolearia DSM 11571]
MIPSNVKEAIFGSIPDQPDTINVCIEYADRCDVAVELETYPVVVTVRYSGDKTDKIRTPVNHILDVQKENGEITYTMGEFRQATLSLAVYAVDSGEIPAGDLLDDYMQLLQTWALKDLPGIVEIAEINEISDISNSGNALTRNFDVVIRTALTYEKADPAAASIETDFSL